MERTSQDKVFPVSTTLGKYFYQRQQQLFEKHHYKYNKCRPHAKFCIMKNSNRKNGKALKQLRKLYERQHELYQIASLYMKEEIWCGCEQILDMVRSKMTPYDRRKFQKNNNQTQKHLFQHIDKKEYSYQNCQGFLVY